MNGEIRDREKTMRSLKKANTPIVKEYKYFITILESIRAWMRRKLQRKRQEFKLKEKTSGLL
jgi:hypothetical protein